VQPEAFAAKSSMWGSRYTSGSVTTVEAAKIAAQTTTAVGLPHHVKRAGPGSGGPLDAPAA
jgi:hypothetical protein